MRRIIGRLGGFAANGVVTGLATLLSITLILSLHGPGEWSTFAVAQAAGLLLAVLVGFGWAVIGPATIAPLTPADRTREYTVAVWVRVAIFVLLVGMTALLWACGLLTGVESYLPVALAYASSGFSSLWFYVGTGQAWASFFRDALPRAAASVIAPLAALGGPPQLILGAVIFAGNATALIASWTFVRSSDTSRKPWLPTRIDVRSSVAKQWHGLVSGGISSVYMTLPTVVVGAMIPTAAGLFALGDKFVKLTSTAILPLTQVLQGWVPRGSAAERSARVRRALAVATIAGLAAGLVLAVFSPLAARILSSGQIALDWHLSVPMGVILMSTLVTQVAGTGCLGAYQDYRAIAQSAALGAALGLPVLLIGTRIFGAPGAMWSIVIAEVAVLGYQILALRKHLRMDRHGPG